MNANKLKQYGEDQWRAKPDKLNAELFVMTYGALVMQLVQDYEDYGAVNKELDKMGYNIGTRLIEEFLSKNPEVKCKNFNDTGEAIAKVGFKTFLNITPEVVHNGSNEFTLVIEDNPLNQFVVLPDTAIREGLLYSNVLAGCIRGCLEMINISTTVDFLSDELLGQESTAIKVKLIKYLEEQVPSDDM
ncbi:putative TRAPP complex component Bet3 [Wallemia mellicola]|uniref:Trafficking protein particle complex subunit BET3 n=1 Tax=Wallemia mellicola TaxID=1708541 RepID=A0A4T0RAN3_9BASI|nr:putative TRAPP complex component Bet3 [Wallemia mellicola]